MQKRMFIIVGSLLLAVGFAFLVLSSSLPPLRVAVSFGGRGTGVATFNLTNQNSRSIHLCGTYFLRQQGIEQVLSFGPNILLTNGQSHIVTIPAPTNGAPWRVVFICSRDEWRRRLNDKIGPSRFLDCIPDSIRVAAPQHFETDWIDK